MSDDIQMLRDLGEVKAELSAVKAELAGLRERIDDVVISNLGAHGKRMSMLETRVAAFEAAIRFASAPIIRCCAAVGGSAALRMRHTPCGCRSAHLVEVRSNFRLSPVSSMRRAQQCRIPNAVCRPTTVTRASR